MVTVPSSLVSTYDYPTCIKSSLADKIEGLLDVDLGKHTYAGNSRYHGEAPGMSCRLIITSGEE
jgi:hypothetical protein